MGYERLLKEELRVLNIGLENFYTALIEQNVRVVNVRPRQRKRIERELEEALNKLL